MIKNHKISLLKFALIALLIEWPMIVSYFWMTGDFSAPRFNVWPISDWLINYQTGFVRRGLVGELLLRLFGDGSLSGVHQHLSLLPEVCTLIRWI